MKRLIVIVPLLLIPISNRAFAQATCTLDCCNECFVYYFCTDSGTQYYMCSNSPHEDGSPTMSFIPSCVTVDNVPSQGIYQPQTGVPAFTEMPPGRTTVWNNYRDSCLTDSTFLQPPWAVPYNHDASYWLSDSSAYVAGLEQWNLDSINFFADSGSEEINTTGLDDTATNFANNYWSHDFEAFIDYEAQYTTYQTDSTRHFTGNDVPYDTIWSQALADTDANNALHNWLNICEPPVPPSVSLSGCCLHVVMDSNARDFGTGQDAVGVPAEAVGGWAQSGFPACDDTSVCPTFARYIQLNVTYNFFEQSVTPIVPNPAYTKYILHSVPQYGFYTSQTGIPSVYTGFSSISFYQLMEHEIGHFLGMTHPDQVDTLHNITCSNCYTKNPPWILNGTAYIPNPHAIDGGFHTVMGPVISPNQPPLQLTNEDSCEFQKLYCPGADDCLSHGSCALDGVSPSVPVPDWFNPEVFPNPTNGGMTLTFTLPERSLTQIAIYDVLGNQVRLVSEDYLNAGPQSISLGTETLPSGNYVCRVRVGNQVNYINLAITR